MKLEKSMLWSVAFTVLAAGCGPLHLPGPVKFLEKYVEAPPSQVRIVYRTGTERLQMASVPLTVHQASHRQQAAASLPDSAYGTLVIQHPHPNGNPDSALVTAQFAAHADGRVPAFSQPGILGRIAGQSPSEPAAEKEDYTFREVWTMDLPKWELDAIVDQLKKEGFYEGKKEPSPQAFVSTEIDGSRDYKDFHEIVEVDSLLVRIRREGRQLKQKTNEPPATAP